MAARVAGLLLGWTAVGGRANENASAIVTSDCEYVMYDHTDTHFGVRTMVVEDHSSQRSLVSMNAKDQSLPCHLQWWLDHNPQGLVKCAAEGSETHGLQGPGVPKNKCNPKECGADADDIMNGYVRTMLASALMAPQAHVMSALCIEMGCRAVIKKAIIQDSFLQKHVASDANGEAPWSPRNNPRNVLVIGLGSSTMALWFRKHYPDTTLDIAELLPSVVESAPCFGLDTDDPKLHLHVADGRAFLKNSKDGGYDAILIDAFDPEEGVPPCFRTHEFFTLAKSKLASGGALSFNLLSQNTSMPLLKGLVENFATNRVWVGDAPGAEGIQQVITAFSPGEHVPTPGGKDSMPRQAEQWFENARYRGLEPKALDKVKAFEDKDLCSNA